MISRDTSQQQKLKGVLVSTVLNITKIITQNI